MTDAAAQQHETHANSMPGLHDIGMLTWAMLLFVLSVRTDVRVTVACGCDDPNHKCRILISMSKPCGTHEQHCPVQ